MRDFLGVVVICGVFVLAVMMTPPKRNTPALQVRVVGRDIPIAVTLSQLINTPAAYDGKLVSVVGMAKFEFEGKRNALYPGRRELEERRTESAVYLALWPMPEKLTYLDDHYVVVEAVFDALVRDRAGVPAGFLTEIRRIEENRYFPYRLH